MLHILWLVIKFILIVLGIVLGLVLLAAALLLFCPVRYRASACKEGAEWKLVKAKGAVSWLFGGIAAHVCYEEGEMRTSIRILGISIDKFLEKRMNKASSSERSHPETAEEETAEAEKITETEKTTETEEIAGIEDSTGAEETAGVEIKPPQRGQDESFELYSQTPPKRGIGELIRSVLEKLRQILTAPLRLLRALAAIPGRIVQKIRNIALTFRGIYAKIDWWKQFVNHPRTQEAISLVWNHAKGLIKHVLPTKIEGKVTFGSEEPAVTGTVLAILGMSFPLHKNRIAVNPLFDGENVLEGDVWLKGRIYGWVLLKAAVTIYFNKNVKYVINRWKHKEG